MCKLVGAIGLSFLECLIHPLPLLGQSTRSLSVGLVAALMFCYLCTRLSGRRRGRRLQQGEKIVYSSSANGAAEVVAAAGAGDATFERGKMVFLEDLSCMQQRRHEAVRAGGAVARVRRDAGQGRVRHGVHSSRVPEDPMNLFYSIHTQG